MPPTDDTEPLPLDRWADRRADYIAATTLLSRREGLAVAYSEQGFSDAGVAKRVGCSEGTATEYLDRAVAAFGPSARYARLEPALQHDLDRVTRARVIAWPQHLRNVWGAAADAHPDYAPELGSN